MTINKVLIRIMFVKYKNIIKDYNKKDRSKNKKINKDKNKNKEFKI